jgi:hypothetical protein
MSADGFRVSKGEASATEIIFQKVRANLLVFHTLEWYAAMGS